MSAPDSNLLSKRLTQPYFGCLGFIKFKKQKDPKKHNAPRTLSIKHNQRNAESIKPCYVCTLTYLLVFVKLLLVQLHLPF